MPFEPSFMRRLAEFKAALARLRTADEWLAFKADWFADQPWPRRPPEALAALSPGAEVTLAGRTFRRAPLPDDLTPEARYQYFAALQAGFACLYPPDQAPGMPGTGYRVHCPACEHWSDDVRGDACPGCGRPLLKMLLAPPRPPVA
jgi:hypothetical protein